MIFRTKVRSFLPVKSCQVRFCPKSGSPFASTLRPFWRFNGCPVPPSICKIEVTCAMAVIWWGSTSRPWLSGLSGHPEDSPGLNLSLPSGTKRKLRSCHSLGHECSNPWAKICSLSTLYIWKINNIWAKGPHPRMSHLMTTNHQNPVQSHFSCCINVLNNWEAGSEQDDVKPTKAGLRQCHRLGRLLLCKSCDNTMCIFINTDIHIFIYIIYDAASQVPPPMGMGIQELCSPPPLWVGRGVGGLVVSSS